MAGLRPPRGRLRLPAAALLAALALPRPGDAASARGNASADASAAGPANASGLANASGNASTARSEDLVPAGPISARPCRHGHLQKVPEGNETCSCGWPREARMTPEGGTDCVLTDCGHGSYNFTDAHCGCREGWRHAGLTNPWDFVQGRCTQYKCSSDDLCSELLGLPGATCPVLGWNCDCGLLYSLRGNDNAQCMYPWWALGSKATRWFSSFFASFWLIALVAAVCLLPFGKNVVGTADCYSSELLSHDLAWTLFALKLGAWLYAFSTAAYLCTMLMLVSLAALIILVAMILTLAVICVMGCMALSGEGAGASACDATEFCACDCAGASECGACHLAECTGVGGSECCCCFGGAGGAADAEMAPMALYSYEPCWCYTPYYGPFGGATADCDCICCCGSCRGPSSAQQCWTCFTWIPCFRALVAIAPRLPENMLGGLLGIVVGTHPLRNRYDPQSWIVRALARPCWSLSNRGDRWRRVVYEWLHERDAFEAVAQTGGSVAEARLDGSARVLYGGIAVEKEAGFFTAAERIFNYEDYHRNQCWICQQGADSWDLWVSCRHIFCERCSNEMLRRQMPCPLCRVRSGRVLRRQCRGSPSCRQDGGEAEGANLLPESFAQGGSPPRRLGFGSPARPRARSPALTPVPQPVPPQAVGARDNDV